MRKLGIINIYFALLSNVIMANVLFPLDVIVYNFGKVLIMSLVGIYFKKEKPISHSRECRKYNEV